MDTYYFRRGFGVMVFRDSQRKKNLSWQYVKYETIKLYREGIRHLEHNGCTVLGIVCDGRRGIFKAFDSYPIQMCQFHQKAIITRYLTQKPRQPAAIELKELCNKLTQYKQEQFTDELRSWHERWKDFLKEKTVNSETNNSHYTHKRLRSAYRSLKTHLPNLFVYKKYLELKIPNTTNSIEGKFSGLAKMLGNHAGLRAERKKKLVNYFLGK